VLQEFEQAGFIPLSQEPGTTRAFLVSQGIRSMVSDVSLQPVINDTGSHLEASSNCRDRLPLGNFKNRQGAAVDPGIVGFMELALQTTPLPDG
jgi:hypothetical protein